MQDPSAEITGVVTLLLKGSTSERQKALKDYFTEDSLFLHPMLSLRGRHEIFDLYQYWYDVNFNIQFNVNRIVLSPEKDILCLDIDEFISPKPFARLLGWSPLIRLIIFLHLQKTPSGWKIQCQEDTILWAESALKVVPWVDRFWRIYLRRCVGLFIVWVTRVFGMVYRFLQSRLFNKPNEYDSKLSKRWDASLGQKTMFFETSR